MTEHAVVIAGGGPTGLMLAAELALAGVDVAIVERRTSQERRPPAREPIEADECNWNCTVTAVVRTGMADRFSRFCTDRKRDGSGAS
jgi:2-polyprenyl-6-methoxyphenol hydroxylase-like FAD-dependent oxidoreductase